MHSQYARTTSPQLPDNSPLVLTFSSIRHLHFFTCRYARPKWQRQERRKFDRERKFCPLRSSSHTENNDVSPGKCGKAPNDPTGHKGDKYFSCHARRNALHRRTIPFLSASITMNKT